MKALLGFFIGMVVLTSGCLSSGGDSEISRSYGLGITSFAPDLASLEEGDKFSIILEVENNGGSDAVNAHALLHGLPLGETVDSFVLSGDQLRSLGTIDAPDESLDLPGGLEIIEWRLTAPNVPTGLTVDYEPRVRLMHSYFTSASTTLVAVSEDEYARVTREGGDLPTQRDTLVSKGPLGIGIQATQDPAVIRGEDDDIDMVITVNRLGSGTIFSPDSDAYKDNGEVPVDDLHLVSLKITAPGVTADEGRCDSLGEETTERLIRGDSLRVNCELRTGSFIGIKEIPVRVDVEYNYLVDRSTSISVASR